MPSAADPLSVLGINDARQENGDLLAAAGADQALLNGNDQMTNLSDLIDSPLGIVPSEAGPSMTGFRFLLPDRGGVSPHTDSGATYLNTARLTLVNASVLVAAVTPHARAGVAECP